MDNTLIKTRLTLNISIWCLVVYESLQMISYFVPIIHCRNCKTLYSPPIKINIMHPLKWNKGKIVTYCRNRNCKCLNKDFGVDLKIIIEPILNGILNNKNPFALIKKLSLILSNLKPPYCIITIQKEVEKLIDDIDMPGYMLKLDLTPKQMIILTLLICETTIANLDYLDEEIMQAFSENSIKLQIIQQIVNQNILIKGE